jgi:hypothetical protein
VAVMTVQQDDARLTVLAHGLSERNTSGSSGSGEEKTLEDILDVDIADTSIVYADTDIKAKETIYLYTGKEALTYVPNFKLNEMTDGSETYLTPNGRWLFTVRYDASNVTKSTIALYDTAYSIPWKADTTHTEFSTILGSSDLKALTVHGNGPVVVLCASIGDTYTSYLYNAETAQLIATLNKQIETGRYAADWSKQYLYVCITSDSVGTGSYRVNLSTGAAESFTMPYTDDRYNRPMFSPKCFLDDHRMVYNVYTAGAWDSSHQSLCVAALDAGTLSFSYVCGYAFNTYGYYGGESDTAVKVWALSSNMVLAEISMGDNNQIYTGLTAFVIDDLTITIAKAGIAGSDVSPRNHFSCICGDVSVARTAWVGIVQIQTDTTYTYKVLSLNTGDWSTNWEIDLSSYIGNALYGYKLLANENRILISDRLWQIGSKTYAHPAEHRIHFQWILGFALKSALAGQQIPVAILFE